MIFPSFRRNVVAFAILAVLTADTALRAQVYSGTITGLVTDPSGAAVPNAQGVLTDEDKGFTFKTASGNDGRYVLRNLAPGRYRLTVSAPGMRIFSSPEITLNVGQNAISG